jgi:hypothetical protein
VARRLTLLLTLAAAAALVPPAQGGSGARMITIKVMSHARVTIPHDLAPKGREN